MKISKDRSHRKYLGNSKTSLLVGVSQCKLQPFSACALLHNVGCYYFWLHQLFVAFWLQLNIQPCDMNPVKFWHLSPMFWSSQICCYCILSAAPPPYPAPQPPSPHTSADCPPSGPTLLLDLKLLLAKGWGPRTQPESVTCGVVLRLIKTLSHCKEQK